LNRQESKKKSAKADKFFSRIRNDSFKILATSFLSKDGSGYTWNLKTGTLQIPARFHEGCSLFQAKSYGISKERSKKGGREE
jgi:hypothetical protein